MTIIITIRCYWTIRSVVSSNRQFELTWLRWWNDLRSLRTLFSLKFVWIVLRIWFGINWSVYLPHLHKALVPMQLIRESAGTVDAMQIPNPQSINWRRFPDRRNIVTSNQSVYPAHRLRARGAVLKFPRPGKVSAPNRIKVLIPGKVLCLIT